ncbi:MAG: Phosphate acetyltransferase [candidate division WS2 bacterium]|uniref:Phosphate acetyltransferase n=1 Tax=Psychracetigena formicireducens TaxID=2986056 RepID=A0A9E2BEN3_PSYF1|nr:Phosphate acetyltransferase [Candidatus Psychracetigena formicireducens]
MINSFQELLNKCTNRQVTVVVAGGEDPDVLKAIKQANDHFSLSSVLVGNKEKINDLILNYNLSNCEIYSSLPGLEAINAVSIIKKGKADVLMKGNISTSSLLKAVLDKDSGLRTNKLLSHVAVFEIPALNRLIILSDGGMNVAPTLKEKVEIINNALEVARVLEIETPKVAVLAAVETVSENMPATMEAAILTQMNKRGQIKGCLIDGPLALDGAISREAALHKGITSMVAGEADILLVPDIEAGNILGKSFSYLAQSLMAGVVLGTTKPIILPSRTDPASGKLASIALTLLLSSNRKEA